MLLRDVDPGDVDAYVRMRCDPAMMAELGGPSPRRGIEAKVRADAAMAAADTAWLKMIVPDPHVHDGVAGLVSLWTHELDGEPVSEIGWMVLPEHQGRGLAKRSVRAILELARADGRWGPIHAFPSVTNAPSNHLCRSTGFTLLGERPVPYAGQILTTNHWRIDPVTDLPEAR